MTVLKQQRANNIQIEIKRLPAARHIRTAILNMDQSFFNKEMIEVVHIITCNLSIHSSIPSSIIHPSFYRNYLI